MSNKHTIPNMKEFNYYALKAVIADMKEDPDRFHEIMEGFIEQEVAQRVQVQDDSHKSLAALAKSASEVVARMEYLHAVSPFVIKHLFTYEQLQLILAALVNIQGLNNKGFFDLLDSLIKTNMEAGK